MSVRLTQVQLEQIVAQVEHLSEKKQAELETQQVREILQELNLPPELLEEAMEQLRIQEARAIKKRRHIWLFGGIASLASLMVLFPLLLHQNQQQKLAQIRATDDRITLAQDNGNDLNSISSQQEGEIFYRVTLSDAPVGKQLSLSCNWINPKGQIVHQNHYQTKKITTPVWNTFCRYQMTSNAPVGSWEVQMFLGENQLSEATLNMQ